MTGLQIRMSYENIEKATIQEFVLLAVFELDSNANSRLASSFFIIIILNSTSSIEKRYQFHLDKQAKQARNPTAKPAISMTGLQIRSS